MPSHVRTRGAGRKERFLLLPFASAVVGSIVEGKRLKIDVLLRLVLWLLLVDLCPSLDGNGFSNQRTERR